MAVVPAYLDHQQPTVPGALGELAAAGCAGPSHRPAGGRGRWSGTPAAAWSRSTRWWAEPISITLNGCPNSCARFQLADIGLKGSIVSGQEGFQVHLGGSLGAEPGFGRKQRGLEVTAAELPDYVERLLRGYLADRTAGEPFAAWARRAPDEALA